MIRTLLVGLLIASPALAEPAEEREYRKTDDYVYRKMLESLQGQWGVKNMFVAGRPAAAGARYTIEEDRLIKTDQPEESARLTIDVSGPVPKVEYLDRHGITMLGIMQRTPNGVVFCLVEAGTEPPKAFRSTPDNKAVLIELAPARP
jgi:hypothetical protein